MVVYNRLVKHVSILLVHYNDQLTTDTCINSVAKLVHPGYKLQCLIVDNGSIKPYVLPKKLRTSKKFTVIRSDANLGFTGGNNLGIHYAVEKNSSQYILLLNNDTTIKTDAVKKMLDLFESDTKIGIVTPKIYFSAGKEFHKDSYNIKQRGKVLWFAGGTIDWNHLTAFHRGVDEVDRGQFDHASSTDFATGCALFIRREVLEKIGFLDKRYFLYFEDVDLSLRVKKAGYRIQFCPEAVVWHDNAGSSGGSGSETQVYYQERNRYLLAISHGTPKIIPVVLWLQWQAVVSGNRLKQRAVYDFYRRAFGKQPLI